MISILKITKGHHSVETIEFWYSAHWLMMLYMCTKFHETIFPDIKLIEWTSYPN